ncbi:hypothetical protein PEp14_00014 [Erwinia phage PEp14]|uniref:Uncharacterized protein n=1 Tax=Erwinia phage PEp14 TaxID=1131315 RepID=H2DE44_9CAUD|nr:virion structural protein [Erwinia phage PEp14]AEY69603.1 hypothetical protein PEp14_00014 [Erwinia phage PEp14]
MIRDIEELLPKVMQWAPGCPEPTAVEHVRAAAVKLCKRTRCWRDHDQFEVAGRYNDIPAILPGTALFEIESLTFDGDPLEPVPFSTDMLTRPGEDDETGRPGQFSMMWPNAIMLHPGGTGTVHVSMFLMPSDNAETLPVWMFDQFSEELVAGALSTLLLLPNQPFMNPQMAALFGSQFAGALDRNFAFNKRGQQRARVRTKPSYL